MYKESARYYDEIYSFKDYRKESEKLHRLIRQYKESPGNSLLDVACGTGNHITFLKKHYVVEGLDVNENMLSIAKEKHPDVTFHCGDMTRFNLRKKYDVITCLFSAVGHVQTVAKLGNSLRSFAKHARPGGVVIVEPWIIPSKWKGGGVHANFVNKPNLKIARISIGRLRGRTSINWMHHLIGTPKRVEYFVEELEMGLFTHREYLSAFQSAGLKTSYDHKGLIGRGLYIGTKPVADRRLTLNR